MPITLVVAWHAALHLMHAGDWCTHLAGRWYACTAVHPERVLIRRVPFRDVGRLARHGFECTHAAGWWWCTPNQIPR